VIAIADAPRETSRDAITALRELGVRAVMLTGDSHATARRVAAEIGVEEVIAEVLPGDKAGRVAALQQQGRKVAMVGDGVNDAPALAQADVGIAIGAGTDVAVETADVVLMRSDPLDVATAITIGRGTRRKMRQNLAWAIGYNSIALPIAGGALESAGFTLSPAIGALAMSGSSVIVALNAVSLRHLRLPGGRPAPPAVWLLAETMIIRSATRTTSPRTGRPPRPSCSRPRRSPSGSLRRPGWSMWTTTRS